MTEQWAEAQGHLLVGRSWEVCGLNDKQPPAAWRALYTPLGPQLWAWFPVPEQQETSPYHPVTQCSPVPPGTNRHDFLVLDHLHSKSTRWFKGTLEQTPPHHMRLEEARNRALVRASGPASSQEESLLGPGPICHC